MNDDVVDVLVNPNVNSWYALTKLITEMVSYWDDVARSSFLKF